jgi:uncharacterized protein YqfA (UPF0365 family)
MLTFLWRFVRGIDPFAIRQALRRLREAGVDVDPHVLERHYVAAGGVESLVNRILENKRGGSPLAIHELCAAGLREVLARSSDNPKLVNPVGWAVLYSGMALAVMAAAGIPVILRFRGLIGPWFLRAVGGVVALAVCSATSFAFLGARYGRKTANRVVCLALAVLLVGGVVTLVFGKFLSG